MRTGLCPSSLAAASQGGAGTATLAMPLTGPAAAPASALGVQRHPCSTPALGLSSNAPPPPPNCPPRLFTQPAITKNNLQLTPMAMGTALRPPATAANPRAGEWLQASCGALPCVQWLTIHLRPLPLPSSPLLSISFLSLDCACAQCPPLRASPLPARSRPLTSRNLPALPPQLLLQLLHHNGGQWADFWPVV